MPTNSIIAVTLSLAASRWQRIPLQMPRICLNKLGSETQATGTFSGKGDTLCVKVLSLPPFFPSPHIQRVDIPSSPRQEKLSFQCTAVWEAMQKTHVCFAGLQNLVCSEKNLHFSNIYKKSRRFLI